MSPLFFLGLLLTLRRTIRVNRSELRNDPSNAGIQKHRESRSRAMEGISNYHMRKPQRDSSGINSFLKGFVFLFSPLHLMH